LSSKQYNLPIVEQFWRICNNAASVFVSIFTYSGTAIPYQANSETMSTKISDNIKTKNKWYIVKAIKWLNSNYFGCVIIIVRKITIS